MFGWRRGASSSRRTATPWGSRILRFSWERAESPEVCATATIFLVVACRDELDRFDKVLKQRFELKCMGYMDFAEDLKDELKFLSRTIRLSRSEKFMEIEADQRHVPRLLEELSPVDAKGVPTPRVKRSCDEAVVDEPRTRRSWKEAAPRSFTAL